MEATSSGTIHRAARMLGALADSDGEVRITDLAERLGLPVSTVHRLLHLMREEGLVVHHPTSRSYTLGPALYRIAARVVRTADSPALARRHAETLAQRFGETAVYGLYLPSPPSLAFAALAEGRHQLQYRLPMDEPRSLIRGAPGKSVLAQLPENTVRRALAAEPAQLDGGAPKPSLQELADELNQIRVRGYANTASEKTPGARGVAAPVFGPAGVCGCLCITAPVERLSAEGAAELGEALKEEARKLSWSLGAGPLAA